MEIVILTIIILVLAVILFFALKKLIASITIDSKDYYMKRMQDYDDEILSKAKELELMGKDSDNPVQIEKNKEDNSNNKEVDKDLLSIMNETEYSSDNALKIANKVDEIFNIDEEKIIKEFLSNIKLNEDYKTYQSLYDRFSPNLIFKLKMLNKETQIKELEISIKRREILLSNENYVNKAPKNIVELDRKKLEEEKKKLEELLK